MEYSIYLRENIIVTCVSYVLFYYVIRNYFEKVSRKLETYQKLSRYHQLDWIDRLNSNIHAVIICILSTISINIDTIGSSDPIWGQHWLSSLCMSISTGYAVADLAFLLFIIGANKSNYGTVVHHISMILGQSVCIVFGCFGYPWLYRILSELSTPFLNTRFILQMAGKKDSSIAFYNNLLFAITFFLCRIVIMPYCYIVYYNYVDTESMLRMGGLRWGPLILLITIDFLNIYWFGLILRGFYRALYVKKHIKE